MATVHIPAQLASLTGGHRTAVVPGRTLGEIIDGLEALYPGIRARLVEGDRLRPGLAAAVDNVLGPPGLLQAVGEKSEVHFIPAMKGG